MTEPASWGSTFSISETSSGPPRRRPSPLSGPQFASHESGLFPVDHPAMRQRTPAEFDPHEFAEKPGAWFHGTYRHEMPDRIAEPMSAGIHLGTKRAAQERIDSFGARDISVIPPRAGIDSHEDFQFKPADIHVRRLAPDVEHEEPGEFLPPGEKKMKGSPDNPRSDRGSDWKRNSMGADRGADHFGEYYTNEGEDVGSTSIRVPDSSYLQSHRQAASEAIRAGKPVHPQVAGLLRDFGGRGLDNPIPYTAGDTLKEGKGPLDQHGIPRNDASDEAPDHSALLPYKLRGNPLRAVHAGDMPKDSYQHPRLPWQRASMPAVTFAATPEDVSTMVDRDEHGRRPGPGSQPRWTRAYRADQY